MIKYMLDTNICIYLIKKRPPKLIKKLQAHTIDDFGLSSIVYSELVFGVEKSNQVEKNTLALRTFVSPFEILPFDDMAAENYGRIRSQLEQNGKVIGNMDMLIAAHSLSQNATLITNNEKEFKRIKGLNVENWS